MDRGLHSKKPSVMNRIGMVVGIILPIVISGFLGVAGTTFWYKDHPIIHTSVEYKVAKPPETADRIASIRALAKELEANGYNDIQIAAIAGNIYGESYGDSEALEAGKSTAMPDKDDMDAVRAWAHANNAGIGMLQWTADRMDSLLDYAKTDKAHRKWYDPALQTDYLLTELESDSYWTKYKDGFWNATSVTDATKAMEEGFVRPLDPQKSYKRRAKAALQVWSAMQLGEL